MNRRSQVHRSKAIALVAQEESSLLARWLTAFLLLAAVLVLLPISAHAGLKRTTPFAPGEKFTFDIYWTVVYAGQATLEVLPHAEIKGEPARHFQATARTSKFADAFYKVRDKIDSWTDMEVARTLKFHQVQREGTYEKDTIFDMDWPAGKLALYGIQGYKGTLDLTGPVLDSLSVLYSFRTHPLFPGQEVVNSVTDGKVIVDGVTTVLERETVETELGEFDCYKVSVDTKDIGGVFKKSKGASIEMWFTADDRRLPVKLASKVVVGKFTLELVKMQAGAEVAAN